MCISHHSLILNITQFGRKKCVCWYYRRKCTSTHPPKSHHLPIWYCVKYLQHTIINRASGLIINKWIIHANSIFSGVALCCTNSQKKSWWCTLARPELLKIFMEFFLFILIMFCVFISPITDLWTSTVTVFWLCKDVRFMQLIYAVCFHLVSFCCFDCLNF